MKKTLLPTILTIGLLIVGNLPFIVQASPSNMAPPPPITPTPTSTPLSLAGMSQGNPTPPTPGEFQAQVEQTRARQAMEAALAKYLRYWGPRYQVAPIEVAVEGEWAHGVAKWQSQTRTLSGPIHILAHRLPNGTWQALLPSSDGLYRQWIDATPESLVPASEKSLLRAQAAEADALLRPQATTAVPPAEIRMPPGKEGPGEPVEPVPGSAQPTATPTPVYSLTTTTGLTEIAMVKGTVAVEQQIESTIRLALSSARGVVPNTNYYSISAIQETDNWLFVSVVGLEGLNADLSWNLYDAIWVGLVLLHQDENGRWTGAVEGTPEFSLLLANIPERILSAQAKQSLDPLQHGVVGTSTSYRFPWQSGTSMQYGSQGVHDAGFGLGWKAVDFLSDGNTSAGHAPNRVLAAASGSISYVCWDGTSVAIRIGDLLYAHLLDNANLKIGHYFNQGDEIGQLRSGNFHNTCGWAEQGTNWFHLHWGFPNTGSFQAENWTLTFSDHLWRRGSETRGIYSWFLAGEVSTCGLTGIPSGYHRCADENGRCNFSGTANVIYGANNCYTSPRSFSNGVDCNNNVFGDPVPGVAKACYTNASSSSTCGLTGIPSGYNYCATEGSFCNFNGTANVIYGANNCYTSPRSFTDGTACINEVFGDPVPGVQKKCYTNGSPVAECNPNADQVALYAATGYHGSCVTLGVGDYPNPGYLGSLGNDNAESIRVGSNVQAILYEHYNYQGRSETFTGDDSNLGDNYIGANTVSSVKVQWRVQPPAAPTLQSPANGSTFNEGQGINLSWSATGNEYYGEVWGGPGGTLTFGWQSGTSKNIGSQWAGYTYSWHVKARNGAGQSGWSSTWTFTVKPAAPSNLSAQTTSCNQVTLYWTDNSGNEEGYKIYRNGFYVGQVGMNATSYQDTGLSENTTYSYYVRAFRGSIESDTSNTVNVTTPFCCTKPDLTPSQWGGWQYPVVPSSITGTVVVNTLYAGRPTYIDWGLTNAGHANTGGNTYGALYIDATRVGYYDFGNVLAGQTWAFFDWMETINVPGWHTLKSVSDPDNLIDECDESNNTFEHQFYWIPSAPYYDDMESGTNGWTATGLWHQVDFIGPAGWRRWWYGQDSTNNYDTGAANSGDLTSPPVYIPSTGYYLRFLYYYETETQGPDWDQRWVQISVDGGPFNNVLQLYDDPMVWWLQSQVIDLSGYAGHTIQVRFHFDTIDDAYNDYRGWYIDNFDISATPPPSCADTHEPNNTPTLATAIAYGQTLSADICPGGDYDYYRFTGTAGDRIVVDIDTSNESWLDSYVFLLDSDGTSVLAGNDDEIPGVRDSHLGYHLPHDGTYYIKVKAWNHPSAGGTEYFYTIHLLTDETNPSTVEITSPGNDAWLDPNMETIAVTAADNESGINRVEFLWHDADWQNSDWIWLGADNDGRDGWSWDFDTSSLSDQQGGAFYIWAFDWVGNWTGAGTWNLGIDRTAPTASTYVSPMYGDAPFRDFHVWWNGDDNLSGIAGYDVQYRDGVNGVWTNLVTGTTDTYYRFIGQNGHTYYFRTRAYDRAGNVGSYSTEVSHTVQTCAIEADAYEVDNAYTSAHPIETDGLWQMHNFHAEGDQDWVRFIALPGITYTLVTTNTGGHADTVIYLYGSDGNTLIDYNDDDPENWPASRLVWQPSTGGLYYIKVKHWDPYAYGCTTGYGLSVTPSQTIYHTYLPVVIRGR